MSYSTTLGMSYREAKALIQKRLEALERTGLLKRTGEYRKARDGSLEPVYAATETFRRQLGLEPFQG